MPTPGPDRRASSLALPPPVEPPPAPREIALEALASVQASHDDLHKLLRELRHYLKLANEPATLETLRLTATTPIVRSGPLGSGRVARSVGAINPNNIKVYLGIGAARAAPGSEAVSLAPSSALVVPVFAEDLDVGADPVDLAAGDAIVHVLRFEGVQPFFFGAF